MLFQPAERSADPATLSTVSKFLKSQQITSTVLRPFCHQIYLLKTLHLFFMPTTLTRVWFVIPLTNRGHCCIAKHFLSCWIEQCCKAWTPPSCVIIVSGRFSLFRKTLVGGLGFFSVYTLFQRPFQVNARTSTWQKNKTVGKRKTEIDSHPKAWVAAAHFLLHQKNITISCQLTRI